MFKVSELVECGFVDGVNAWAIMNMQLHCYTMLHPAISKYIALGKLSTKLCGSFELSGMMWDALAANWRLCFDILTGVHCRILHRYWIRVLANGSERGTAHGTQTPRLDSADSGWLSKVFARPFPWFPLGCVQNCSLCVLFAIGSIRFGDTGDGFVRTSFEKFGRSKKNQTGCSSIASMLSGQSNSWESAEKCLEDLRRSFVKLRRWNGYGRGFDCAYATRAWTQFDTNPTGNGSRCECQNGRTWRWKRLTFRLGFFKQQSQSFTSIAVHGLILTYFRL